MVFGAFCSLQLGLPQIYFLTYDLFLVSVVCSSSMPGFSTISGPFCSTAPTSTVTSVRSNASIAEMFVSKANHNVSRPM